MFSSLRLALGQGDDQFGHVLSARAEGLITQAYVLAILDAINAPRAAVDKIDPDIIRNNVIARLT